MTRALHITQASRSIVGRGDGISADVPARGSGGGTDLCLDREPAHGLGARGARGRRDLVGGHVSTTKRPVARGADLTATELTVAVLLAEGLRQREVAHFTNYSREAVRSQSARIRVKTGARSTCHAVALLLRAGIID